MTKTKIPKVKIIEMLERAEAGETVSKLTNEYGISSATYYIWKNKYSNELNKTPKAEGYIELPIANVQNKESPEAIEIIKDLEHKIKILERENLILKKMFAEERLRLEVDNSFSGHTLM